MLVYLVYLVYLIVIVVGLTSALEEGRNAGPLGVCLSLIVGLLIGLIICMATKVVMSKPVLDRIGRCKEPIQLVLGWVLILMIVGLIIASGLAGTWGTRLLIRIIL